MKRRSFVKAIGAAIAIPSALMPLTAKSLPITETKPYNARYARIAWDGEKGWVEESGTLDGEYKRVSPSGQERRKDDQRIKFREALNVEFDREMRSALVEMSSTS